MKDIEHLALAHIRNIYTGKRWRFAIESGPPIIWFPRAAVHRLERGTVYCLGLGFWILYIGRAGTKGGRGAAGKAIVMGVLQRGGDVRANTIPDTRRRTLQSEVRKHVAPGSAVYTDALPSYRGLSDDYLHEFVDHTYEYVNGRVSTNSLEGFWSLVKRSVDGTYHSVEPVHLDRYLDEFTRRFNTRKLSDAQRFVLTVSSAIGRRLTYKELIGQASTAP